MDIEELKRQLEDDIFKFRLEKEAFEKHKAEVHGKIKQMNAALKRFKQQRSNKVLVFCVNLLAVFLAAGITLDIVEDIKAQKAKQAWLKEQERLELEAEQARQQKEELIKQIKQALQPASIAENMILTGDNEAEVCDYIASLQKYSLNTIELDSYEGTEYYHLTKKTELDRYYLAESGSSTVFPGAILKGDSLFQGTDYTLLSMERTPIWLVSNVQQDGILVDTVNYRGVNSELQKLQKNLADIQAKEWSYNMYNITSGDELKLTLGVEAADVGLDFGYGSSRETSTVAVVYSQTYYSVSAEPPKNAAQYFQQGTNMRDLGAYAPVYVSSVDYGRRIYVFVEGEMSQKELSAAVKGCFDGVQIGAGLEKIKKQGNLSYTVYQYGGSSKELNCLVSMPETASGKSGIVGLWNEFWYGTEAGESLVDKINNFIENDAALENPVPIAYTLKYLSDNSVVPSMSIEGETIILKEDAKTITFTLNDKNSEVELSTPDSEGIFLTDNMLSGSSDKVKLVMDVSGAVVTCWYDGEQFSIDLSNNIEDGVYRIILKIGLFKDDVILEYSVSSYVDEVK